MMSSGTAESANAMRLRLQIPFFGDARHLPSVNCYAVVAEHLGQAESSGSNRPRNRLPHPTVYRSSVFDMSPSLQSVKKRMFPACVYPAIDLAIQLAKAARTRPIGIVLPVALSSFTSQKVVVALNGTIGTGSAELTIL